MKISSEQIAAQISLAAEQFVQEHLDDDKMTFTFAEAQSLADDLKVNTAPIIAAIKLWGLKMEERPVAKAVRGVLSNSHDRWYGPGSCPTAGGSGWEQVSGFAGREG